MIRSRFWLVWILGLGVSSASPSQAWALGKKKSEAPAPTPTPGAPLTGKRVIRLNSVQAAEIELPDETTYRFGEDFQGLFRQKLEETGRYLVVVPEPKAGRALRAAPGFEWESSWTPSAEVRVGVEALSFVSGGRGGRVFYGFDERVNSGWENRNEFPLRKVSFEPNWFDRTFDRKGPALDHSQLGLDLGEGIQVNALFAWLDLKYVHYEARLHLSVEVDVPSENRKELRRIQVKGHGYYYDFAGAYGVFGAGIRLARKDAMLSALRNSISGAVQALDRSFESLPVVARIDRVVQWQGETWFLLGSGPGAGLPVGLELEVRDVPGARLRVERETQSGTVARSLGSEGTLEKIRKGMIAQGSPSSPSRGLPWSGRARSLAINDIRELGDAPLETIELPTRNFPKPQFPTGTAKGRSVWEATLKMLSETLLLPYRLWRYAQYDRAYQLKSDSPEEEQTSDEEWTKRTLAQDWSSQIGLDRALNAESRRVEAREKAPAHSEVIVAILDSGVDYNHPLLHASLYLNPKFTTDVQGRKDRYGWDFLSNDSRPYDDGYHGTQVASLIHAVSPRARLLPVKVFDPFGLTQSAALYAAFEYALDRGAKILVCAWATRKNSQALRAAVKLAHTRGALVIAAAGDRGDDLNSGAPGVDGTPEAYPASLSSEFDSVLAVASLDRSDRLVRKKGRWSNWGARSVQIAAPGEAIEVAEPRARYAVDTGSGLSAALVAGAAARIAETRGITDGRELKRTLLENARKVPQLSPWVEQGRVLSVTD